LTVRVRLTLDVQHERGDEVGRDRSGLRLGGSGGSLFRAW
jgi:hypothetical protein